MFLGVRAQGGGDELINSSPCPCPLSRGERHHRSSQRKGVDRRVKISHGERIEHHIGGAEEGEVVFGLDRRQQVDTPGLRARESRK